MIPIACSACACIARKLLDITWLAELGWRPGIDLRAGIERTYRWFADHRAERRPAVAGEGPRRR